MVVLIFVRLLGISLATLSFIYSGLLCGFDLFSVLAFGGGMFALVLEHLLH